MNNVNKMRDSFCAVPSYVLYVCFSLVRFWDFYAHCYSILDPFSFGYIQIFHQFLECTAGSTAGWYVHEGCVVSLVQVTGDDCWIMLLHVVF